MSKVIRLTESDLHKMIKEAINELDWRTYASAAKKRNAQRQQLGRDATDKGGRRLSSVTTDLDHAASDALSSKYAPQYPQNMPPNTDFCTVNGRQRITTGIVGYNNGTGHYDCISGTSRLYNYDHDGNIEKVRNQKNAPMDDEVEAYVKGKSYYNPDTHAWENDED